MAVTKANERKNPNPQGKGAVPVLRDLGAFNPGGVGRKTPVEFFRDYCVSSLVLAARFHFRPVAEKSYFLYSTGEGWLLSLIGPREWGDRLPGPFVAACTLRHDMTWQVEFDTEHLPSAVAEKLVDFVEGFTDTLDNQDDISAGLPTYVDHLPYYRRVLASGLAASLRLSSPTQPALRAVLDSATLALSFDSRERPA